MSNKILNYSVKFNLKYLEGNLRKLTGPIKGKLYDTIRRHMRYIMRHNANWKIQSFKDVISNATLIKNQICALESAH